MGTFSTLRRDQTEAIVLLQVGTFLEYFDLMIYVHMAILMNELFFPKTDPHTTSLLMALAFCSTYISRPIGALIFGWIGDHIGRKATVIFTTSIMALSCLVMANLPTYATIGIGATWAVTICRVLQGMSSLGERVGAEIYLTEITKPPVRYPVVALIGVVADVGGMMALMVASLATLSWFNWRMAFYAGMVIAVVGTVARTRLRETPDFADMKRRMKRAIQEAKENKLERAADLLKKTNPIWHEKVAKKTLAAYLAIQCAWPVSFYLAYMYCGNFLQQEFGFTAEQVIHQNLIVSIFAVLSSMIVVGLSYKFFPLKILKVVLSMFIPFILLCPFLLKITHSPYIVLCIQCLIVSLTPEDVPANAVFYGYFPVFRRFTYASFISALSRVLMAIITSFGLVYLTDLFGYGGILLILIPVTLCYTWGLYYFDKLEKLKDSTGSPLSHQPRRPIIHPDEIHAKSNDEGVAA